MYFLCWPLESIPTQFHSNLVESAILLSLPSFTQFIIYVCPFFLFTHNISRISKVHVACLSYIQKAFSGKNDTIVHWCKNQNWCPVTCSNISFRTLCKYIYLIHSINHWQLASYLNKRTVFDSRIAMQTFLQLHTTT